MKRAACASTVLAALAVVTAVVSAVALAGGGPVTKQNGGTPLFKDFTSICAVPGYVNYGDCNGSTTTWANVKGKINAVQPKPGLYNLGLSFSGLEPGATYYLWGNQNPAPPAPGVVVGFFLIGAVVPGSDGTANFSYQTTTPSSLGFDLNRYGYTVVTSYWSSQTIQVLNADGTLYVP
jgi:hypothetical protein